MKNNGKYKNRPALANNIKIRREAKGWTQFDLAEEADIGISTVKSLELGISDGRPETKNLLARVLGCTVADLYETPTDNKDLFRSAVSLLFTFNESELEMAFSTLNALRSAATRPNKKKSLG